MANKIKLTLEGDSKSLKNATSEGSNGLSKLSDKVKAVTATMALMGAAALVAGAAFSIKEAAQFETKMAEVSTLLNDTSGLEGMEQAVKDLAITYGQFPGNQVESLYSIISAGASTSAEAIQTLEAANRLAIGGVTDVAIAADGLTSALNAYGEKAGTVVDVSDAMFVAMKAGKTTIGELSGSIGNVAPIAAEAGVSLDELLGATAALTKTGALTSVSMSGLRQVIASVLKPTAEAAKESKRLGLEFNSTALESKGLQGFLQDLAEKTGGNKDSLTQLFGSVEALGPVFALTGSQAGAFAEIMDDMKNKTGATDIAFGKIEETGAQAFNRLKSASNVLAITIGDQLLPAAADLADFFTINLSGGLNKVEESFFFLRSTAFAVMGGVADSILAVVNPLVEVRNRLNDFMGIEVKDSAFISFAEDLEIFSAAMEEGAIETFKARDVAEEHSIKLRDEADALRKVTNELDAKTKAEKDAAATSKKLADDAEAKAVKAKKDAADAGDKAKVIQKEIDNQTTKYQKLRELAEAFELNDEQREILRFDREEQQFQLDLETLIERGLTKDEAVAMQHQAREDAEAIHQNRLNEIEKAGLTIGQKFLLKTNKEKIASIIHSSAQTLASVAGTNKHIFALHKGLSLASATIALPNAVMQSFENGGGYPWGLIPAGLMAAKGAIEIATIAGTSYGGQAHAGLDRNPAEGTFLLKRNEMVLDSGTSEEVRTAAKNSVKSESGININIENININNPVGSNIDWSLEMENIIPAIYNSARNGLNFPFSLKEGVI